MDELKDKLERYLAKAKPSFETITAVGPAGAKIKDTATRYYRDALHFMAKGELVNAFAALEYAEGWLDAGVASGLVEAEGKDRQSM